MHLVSHTFKDPLAALEGVARDGTARYIAAVLPMGARVTVTFRLPQDIREGIRKMPALERYAVMVSALKQKRKKVYYVGK